MLWRIFYFHIFFCFKCPSRFQFQLQREGIYKKTFLFSSSNRETQRSNGRKSRLSKLLSLVRKQLHKYNIRDNLISKHQHAFWCKMHNRFTYSMSLRGLSRKANGLLTCWNNLTDMLSGLKCTSHIYSFAMSSWGVSWTAAGLLTCWYNLIAVPSCVNAIFSYLFVCNVFMRS